MTLCGEVVQLRWISEFRCVQVLDAAAPFFLPPSVSTVKYHPSDPLESILPGRMASTSSLILPGTLLRSISHLLLSGSNPLSPPLAYAARSLQQPSNPTPTPIPFASWIGSIGRAKDVEEGWEFLKGGVSSGLEHTILGYRSAGVDRVFSVGRNEVGQLGIGFNSQEGTRGLLEGFTGEEILGVGTGCQSSFLLVRKGGGELRFVR